MRRFDPRPRRSSGMADREVEAGVPPSPAGASGFAAIARRPFVLTPAVAIAAILVAVLVAYANSLANGFAFDDWWIIRVNPRLHQLSDLGRIVGTPYWPSRGEELGLYRPLTVLAFA